MTSPSRSISIRNRPGRCRSPASRDRLAHQPAARLDQHLHQVFPPRLLELLDQILAVRQELAADRQEIGRPQERAGQAHPADLEEAHRLCRLALDQQALHDQVGAGADQRAGARPGSTGTTAASTAARGRSAACGTRRSARAPAGRPWACCSAPWPRGSARPPCRTGPCASVSTWPRKRSPTYSITPVSRRPAATTNSAATISIPELANPENASSGRDHAEGGQEHDGADEEQVGRLVLDQAVEQGGQHRQRHAHGQGDVSGHPASSSEGDAIPAFRSRMAVVLSPGTRGRVTTCPPWPGRCRRRRSGRACSRPP